MYLWKNESTRKRFRLTNSYSRWGYDIGWMDGEPALQAADVAAYEFNKVALKAVETNMEIDDAELRKSVLNLCREPHGHNSILLTEKQFRSAFQAIADSKDQHGSGSGG